MLDGKLPVLNESGLAQSESRHTYLLIYKVVIAHSQTVALQLCAHFLLISGRCALALVCLSLQSLHPLLDSGLTCTDSLLMRLQVALNALLGQQMHSSKLLFGECYTLLVVSEPFAYNVGHFCIFVLLKVSNLLQIG